MGTIKPNPNDPIIRNALTTDTESQNENEEKQEYKDIKKNKEKIVGAPDTATGDKEEFDAINNNIHRKR